MLFNQDKIFDKEHCTILEVRKLNSLPYPLLLFHLRRPNAPRECDNGRLGRVIGPALGLLGVEQAQDGGHVHDDAAAAAVLLGHPLGETGDEFLKQTLFLNG